MKPADACVVRFTDQDVAALTVHSQRIGWYESSDWEDFITTGSVFGHRTELGEILSSAYLIEHGASLGWIGAFIVSPEQQGKGLGKALIRRCIEEHAAAGSPLGLVSTEEGKSLYGKFGFEEVGSTSKLVTEAGFKMADCAPRQGCVVREAAGQADLDAICRLDLAAVGADRAVLLDARMKRAVKNLVALDAAGRISGFIGGALDSQRLILGPLVAPDSDTALALISRLSRCWDGCMRIDVPHWQTGLTTALLARGFQLERVCPVMTLGKHSLPATSERYFALAGQAFG